MGKHVTIAIPSYSGTVHIGTMRSIVTDVIALMGRGDVVSLYDEAGGAEIDTARAQIVAEFMAGESTHLVMVDSDVLWQAGALVKMVDAGVDVIAGCYPYRKDPIEFPLHLIDGNRHLTADETGFFEVKAVPAGFMCITRSAIEQMQQAYKDLKFRSSKTDKPCFALFDHIWQGDMRLSEDLSFCHRWRAIGGKIYIDPSITLGHIGTKLFAGSLGAMQDE